MPAAIPALIAGGAAVAGSALSSNASKSAAKSQTAAAQAAANAQVQSTQAQIKAAQDAADKGSALLQPTVDAGDPALHALMGAAGIGGANQTEYRNQYDAGFNGSPDLEDANVAATRGVNALASSAAASGRGGLTSGHDARLVNDFMLQNRGGARQGYDARLNAFGDAGIAGRAGQANLQVGAGSAAVNAFGQQGANLAAIYQNRGNALSAITQGNAANQAGFLNYGANALSSYMQQQQPNVLSPSAVKKIPNTGVYTYPGSGKI